MILSKRKFLSEKQCKKLIELYKNNIHYSFKYHTNSTYPLNIDEIEGITDKIKNICHKFNNSCKLDTHQIVMWPPGSLMEPHIDPENDVFACLIYLNDDYLGGETCFKRNFFFNKIVKPETGKLIVFSNSKILHWVSEVKNGTRYTLALWFVRK